MECVESMKSDVDKWLGEIFQDDFKSMSVKILGTSEKGDGYMGDIIFAAVEGLSKTGTPKEINIVLKCSKRSDELRKKLPVQDAFLNEITIYQSVLPALEEFEIQKGITDPFQSVPKYYGKFVSHDMEVIVLENMKKSGYNLWNRKLPLPRKYIQKVLREYAKFHAISVAMQDQDPEKFEQLSGKLFPVFNKFMETCDFHKLIDSNVQEICELLQDDLEESVIQSWGLLKKDSKAAICTFSGNLPGLKVIIHGDCWCNNFLFNPPNNTEDLKNPEVAILDWQISYVSNPVVDLSYFLFSNISEEDITSIDELLRDYHRVFSNRLENLGSNSNLYSLETFLEDWTKYCPFGFLMSSFVLKVCMSEKSEVPELMDTVRKDLEMSEAMAIEIKDKSGFKERMAYILEYAASKDLITKNLYLPK